MYNSFPTAIDGDDQGGLHLYEDLIAKEFRLRYPGDISEHDATQESAEHGSAWLTHPAHLRREEFLMTKLDWKPDHLKLEQVVILRITPDHSSAPLTTEHWACIEHPVIIEDGMWRLLQSS